VTLLQQVRRVESSTPADARPRVTDFYTDVMLERLGFQEKIGGLWERAGDLRSAVAIYEAEVQVMTELKRPSEARLVRQKVADACEKLHDYKKAAAAMKAIYDDIPAAQRGQNLNFMLRLASLFEEAGDNRSALGMYEDVEKALPSGMHIQGLPEKIASLRSKVGNVQ